MRAFLEVIGNMLKSIHMLSVALAVLLFGMPAVAANEHPVDNPEDSCTYEVTPDTYRDIPDGCQLFFPAEHVEEVFRLMNRDARELAESLAVSIDELVLAVLLNGKPERYCLTIFGDKPSEWLSEALAEEDELLDCSLPNAPRTWVKSIEEAGEEHYEVQIHFDCGLTPRCFSAWKFWVGPDRAGKLVVLEKELIVIS